MEKTKVAYEFVLCPETVADSNGLVLHCDPEWVECKKGELQKHLDGYNVDNVGLFKCYSVSVKKYYCQYEDVYNPITDWEWDWNEYDLYYDHDKKIWIDDTGSLPKYVMAEINKVKFPEGSLQKYPAEYTDDEYSDRYDYDKESNAWICV